MADNSVAQVDHSIFLFWGSPGHKIFADIQEDEEEVVAGCVGPVSPECSLHFLHRFEVQDVEVDFLGDGGWLQRVRNDAVLRPSSAVHVQVPGEERKRVTLHLLYLGLSELATQDHHVVAHTRKTLHQD